MKVSARYLLIFAIILGVLALSIPRAIAANGKAMSDLQLDNSMLQDDEAIICWYLDGEEAPKTGADEGRPYFVLRPQTGTAISSKNENLFQFKKTYSTKIPDKGENLVALTGDDVPDTRKRVDIPFTPEILEVGRSDRPDSSGVACTFAGIGSTVQRRLIDITDRIRDTEQDPDSPRRIPRRRGSRQGVGRSPSTWQLLNPCW